MKGTYYVDLGGDLAVSVSYSYSPGCPGDYHTPPGRATIDIDKLELVDDTKSIDITHCVEELCALSIDKLEDLIQQNIEQ